METQITLSYTELRALLAPVIPFASKHETLPMLSNVAVRLVGGDTLVAQATDRFAAAFRRVVVEDLVEEPVEEPFAMLIPAREARRLLRLLRPARGYVPAGSIELNLSADQSTLRVVGHSMEFACGFPVVAVEVLLGDGTFPDLQLRLPKPDALTQAVPACVVDPSLLSKFKPALKVCGAPNTGDAQLLLHMPDTAGRPLMVSIDTDPDFLALLKPRRARGAVGFGGQADITPALLNTWRGTLPHAEVKVARADQS